MKRLKRKSLFKTPNYKKDAELLLRSTFFDEHSRCDTETDELYESLAKLTKVLKEANQQRP